MTVLEQLQELGIAVRPDGPSEQRVPCPQCGKGERDVALGVNLESGMYHCFRCDWRGRATQRIGEISRRLEKASGANQHIRSAAKKRKAHALKAAGISKDIASRAERLAEIWRRTLPLRGTLGETYLRHRNCVIPPADGDLRFMPAGRYPPSLCGLVTHAVTNERLSVHFTEIKPDGTARGARNFLGGYKIPHGCIRLWPDEAVTLGLAIAEGIETALSAAHAFTPIWSVLDAGHMAQFPVLAGTESLVVFADNDKNEKGQRAARACAQPWADAGLEAEIRLPEHGDFNDVVNT